MLRRSLLAALPPLAAFPALAHPPRQPDNAEAQSLIEEIKAFREKVAKAVTPRTSRPCARSTPTRSRTPTARASSTTRMRGLVSAMAGEPMIENAPASELSYRVFAGPTVIVTGKSPILNVKEQKTYDFRWVAVYVTGRDGWLLAASQATRLPA
jgi:hypothetical protein